MPPFTSTNWTTLVRKVVSAAKQATITANRTVSTASRLTRIQRARLSLRYALHETFPSLHTPSYSLNTSLSHTSHRTFTQTASKHYQSPLSRAGQAFRMTASRKVGTATHKVGLGISPARTFASAPAGSIASHAPIYLRAFVKSIDLDNIQSDPSGPRPSLYTAYKPLRRGRSTRQRQPRRKLSCSQSSIISTVHAGSSCGSWPYTNDFTSIEHIDVHRHFIISDIEHYFPRLRAATPQRHNLLLPETLVHPGMTTVLTVGLSPDLQEILEPNTNVTYRDAQIGITIFANLFSGLVTLMEAFERYRTSRVMPLIAKLESLGLIDTEGVGTSTHLEYSIDSAGVIETLRVVFEGRNEDDVRRILGETLQEEGQEPWFALHEEREMDAGSLSPSERMELSADWDSPIASSMRESTILPSVREEDESIQWAASPVTGTTTIYPVDLSTAHVDLSVHVDLIMPSPNTFTGLRLIFDDDHNAILTPPEPYTYPSNAISPSTSPESFDSPPYSEWTSPSASVISRMVGSETPSSDWSAPPSEADSDLESDMEMSVWNGEDEIQVEEEITASTSFSPDAEESWRSTVRGGGLMQPW